MTSSKASLPDLWDPHTQRMVLEGRYPIPRGSEVLCGDPLHPSIFFGVSKGGTIIAFHGPDARSKFERYAAAHDRNQRRLAGELVFVKKFGNRYAGRVVKRGRTRALVSFKLQNGRRIERYFHLADLGLKG